MVPWVLVALERRLKEIVSATELSVRLSNLIFSIYWLDFLFKYGFYDSA